MQDPIGYDYLHDAEQRVTDERTGGQKGVKATMVGALDPVSMIVLARVAGIGAMKYAAFNFLRGYDWAHSYNAAQRHLNLFWAGEDIDVCNVHGPDDHPFVFGNDESVEGAARNCDGTNLPHPALAAWHGLTLTSFLLRAIGEDTRPPRLAQPIGRVNGPVFYGLDRSAGADRTVLFRERGPVIRPRAQVCEHGRQFCPSCLALP